MLNFSDEDSQCQKRDRSPQPVSGHPPSRRLVSETLLPEDSSANEAPQGQPFFCPVAATAGRPVHYVVEETQAARVGAEHETQAAAGKQPASAAVPDQSSSDDDNDARSPFSANIVAVPAIPSDWTAAPNGDGTFNINFDWDKADADTAHNFLTSNILGTVSKRGMGNYLRHALKTLVKVAGNQKTEQSLFFDGLLKAGAKALSNAAKKGTDLKRHFKIAFDSSRHSFVPAMVEYVLSHPVKLYQSLDPTDDGRLISINHLPQHADINALARVIVLMSDPQVLFPTLTARYITTMCHSTCQVQQLWQVVANEDRSRAAIDDPSAKMGVVNENIEMQLLDSFLNADEYKAPNKVNLAPYSPCVQVDPTLPPRPPKTLLWFREQRRWVKVVMASIQSRFTRKTGGGEQGCDGADADTQFYKYCRGDLLIMFMWLHWERGTAVPQHCTSLLNANESLDIGGSKSCTYNPHPNKCCDSTLADTSSPPKGSSSGGSRQREQQQLDAAFSTLSNIASMFSPAKSLSQGSTTTIDPAESKAKQMGTLAARIQAFEVAKKNVQGDLLVQVQKAIDNLVQEMLAV
jgi:hypothetical protein